MVGSQQLYGYSQGSYGRTPILSLFPSRTFPRVEVPLNPVVFCLSFLLMSTDVKVCEWLQNYCFVGVQHHPN